MKNFIKQHKYYLIILIILLLIAVISGYQYSTMSNSESTIDTEPVINIKIEDVEEIKNETETTDDSQKENITGDIIQTNINTIIDEKSDNITFSEIKIYELKASEYPISSSTTVYNLMQLASADSRQPFLFETKDYGSMGLFIESINGLKNDLQTGKYWIYYVNGESAKIGISNYIVKPGDVIQWRYEESNF